MKQFFVFLLLLLSFSAAKAELTPFGDSNAWPYFNDEIQEDETQCIELLTSGHITPFGIFQVCNNEELKESVDQLESDEIKDTFSTLYNNGFKDAQAEYDPETGILHLKSVKIGEKNYEADLLLDTEKSNNEEIYFKLIKVIEKEVQ